MLLEATADMLGVQCIDLRNKVRDTQPFAFLTVDFPGTSASPFALVHYSLDGDEQKLGLRLDVQKVAFLDHFDDASREAIVQQAAPKIVEILRNSHRSRHPGTCRGT